MDDHSRLLREHLFRATGGTGAILPLPNLCPANGNFQLAGHSSTSWTELVVSPSCSHLSKYTPFWGWFRTDCRQTGSYESESG
jgi:hypothetical protein